MLAAQEDHRVSRATDGVAIALLRRLRAGAEIPFVHHVDACSAAPADLVANLMPAPGTDQTDDGYNSIWYFYYPKRFKNTQGKMSGHRQRGIGTRGDTSWHPEASAKHVRGSDGGGGGTFCTFSYGRMKDGSLERMGWSMVEYDFVDNNTAANTAASNYVLCKVYRPSRAKGKPSSSSIKSAATSSCSTKRKAGSGNPEARPAKLIHIQREQQVQMQHDNSSFTTNDYPMPCYEHHHRHMDHAMVGRHNEVHALQQQQPHAVAPEHGDEFVQTEYGLLPSQLAHVNIDEWIGCQEMFGAEGEDQGLQQPSAEKEQADEFIHIPCGLVAPAVDELAVEDMLGAEMMSGECIDVPAVSTPLDGDFFVGLDTECFFGAQEEARTRPSRSMVPSSSTRPVAPAVAEEVTFEDLFGGPEMMSGEFVSTPTASTQQDASNRASSSLAPSWSTAPSSSAGCSRLVQERPLWFPYLMCS